LVQSRYLDQLEMPTCNPKRFMVYVIKLDLAVLAHRKFWDDNPNYQAGN
jgi:hypothetical protein